MNNFWLDVLINVIVVFTLVFIATYIFIKKNKKEKIDKFNKYTGN